ncbi:hypothetical protein BDV27DRAFT_160845 [Aspergillus caelatus]|uniref:Ricin B lectin domain-containing protein n=2 Tax=Aspergillus subgen. Circumdati TaxID=2720871 RepID=A0A5N6ZUN2_9EURO|nr:uncharacterized protein BDV27DRAFT_160845 [Aspergillus caelatus]KAE8361277.1 hypothetical protein BDV27DRAFT_160845 [Aspergillus caelatus]KAE8412936.1 hypothetical protein BDV36DRAFT_300399 [Aspergillus pseudocaelatus]
MQFSFSIVALIALGGQALTQSATGNYVVTESGNALTANNSQVIFGPADGANDQIWGFSTVGPDTVVIQNQGSGDYLNCDDSGTPCTTSPNPQIFEPIKRGTDLYQIADESGVLFVAESSDKTIHLVLDVPAGEKTVFTLTRPTECEF